MANIKISELNPLLTVEDADVLPIVDNAVTKKVTAAILRSYTQGNSVLLTGAQTVAGIKTFTSQLASSVATGTAPFSVASTTKVTNLNADLLDGLSSADFQATLSGTGIVKSTAGTISYLTDNTANWDTAYNDKINSAAVTGSGTNTLTLTQQDAGTITATWVNGTLIREIRNTTGATLTKGTIVYISGATGNKPTVTKAIASGDSTSAQTFGFIQSDLANNANGYVVVVGDLTGVDTSAFAEGAQLYLSSTVAGTFTDVKQYAPAHLVYVGIVTRSHPTLGQIEVNIQNGYELDELHNVSAQSPSNGDILQFVTSTGLWTKVAGTTTNISEGTNLYFTNARSRSAFSESVTGLDYNSTTGVLSTTSGYGIPTTASQATWDTAYNDSIVSAAVTGTTTKTLTLNQQDGGTVTASWTDINTDAVSSVFGRTGAVVATSGDYTTTQVTEGTNLYFTDARARAAISLTTTGTSGAATYSGGVLNIPQYQAALTNPITGTGTTNYLPKFTGTSALGDSSITDDGTGIGLTISGYSALTLNSTNATDWGSNIKFEQSGTTYGFFGSYGSLVGSTSKDMTIFSKNAIRFNTNNSGTSALIIDTANNVGIGTTSPLSQLQVGAVGTTADTAITIGSTTTSTGNLFFGDGSGANQFRGYLQYDHNVDALNFGTSAAERMRIFSDGNIAINSTTNAGYKLDVNGTARATSLFVLQTISTTSNAESSGSLRFNYATNANSRTWRLANDIDAYGDFAIQQSTTQSGFTFANKLIFSPTGAATFSSTLNAKAGSYINGASNSDWGFSVENTGTTNANGLYVNIGSSSTGIPFRVDKGGSSLFNIANSGAATFSSSVTATDAILSNIKPSINFTLSVNPAFSHSIVGENYSSGAAANNYMDFKVANAANTQQLALRLFGTGAAEFSSSVTANGTGGSPALNIRATDTNFALASILGNQTGDVSWLLMSGYPVAGDFTIRQSDTIDALTIKKTSGAATFSSSVTATKANLYNNAEQLRIAYDNSGSVYTDFRSDSGGGLLINTSGSYIINYLAGVEKMRIKPNTINFASIPTSASGLSAGDIWNDGGTLKIV